MDSLNKLLAELSARLPELEWKMNALNASFSIHSLPKGLFNTQFDSTGLSCVAEIKKDIQALASQSNPRSASYLASRIQQKINVLVTLCQIQSRKNQPDSKAAFGLKMLSTRQQWIQTLEKDISVLDQQRQAITKSLEQMKHHANTAALLSAQAELGEVEKRLTLARETLKQAIS